MSLFSPVHHTALINQFWIGGGVQCPHDGTALSSQFHSHAAGYLLALACMTCGKKVQVTRFSDPQRFHFRPWTGDEIATLVEQAEGDVQPNCPVCQTAVRQRNVSGNSLRSMECLRCGNIHYFPHASLVRELAEHQVAESLAV